MNAHVMTGAVTAERAPGVKPGTSPVKETTRGSYAHLVFALTIFVLVFAGSWRLMDPATLPIRHVRIQGSFAHLSTDKMQSIVSNVLDGGFFNLNVLGIKEALLDEPWVDWVVVKRIWPDALTVQVKEQSAVAHWNDSSLLNETAFVFSPDNASEITGLPFLAGPEGTQAVVFSRYGELSNLLLGIARIEKLSLSERRAWSVQLQHGPVIILGRNDIDARIARLTESVLPNLKGEIENLKRIDLRYTNGFAIEWQGKQALPEDSGQE